MRVLILSNNDSGLYLFRKELIEDLSKENEVICSVPDSDGFIQKLEQLGCRCVQTDFNRRGMNPIEDMKLLKTYEDYLDQFSPDVTLTYTIKPNVYGGMACQRKRDHYLSNVTGLGTTIENGGLLAKISLRMYQNGLKQASCVFFQNKQNKELFQSKRIYNGNAVLIPGSGVNTDTHRLEDYPEQFSEFRFLFVGRVMKDKGIEELLTVIGRMSNEGDNVFLDIVGECDEDYSSLLSKYEQRGIVKYHGQQSEMHSFYTNAHCVVLPSYHEGMANVMLEAASTGRPVITSRIPGCAETFDEDETGFGCEPRDPESLKTAMKKMYQTDWNIRKAMGLAGREKVKKQFDRQIIVDAYKTEIQKAIKTIKQ